MKPLFKLSFFLTTLSITSCYSKAASSTLPRTSNISTSTEITYDAVLDKTIYWDDIFSINRDEYYVYFYSQTCSHCAELKEFIISIALERKDIYFVEASFDVVYLEEIESTIGLKSIENFGIKGYPTLIRIEKGILTKNLAGIPLIKNELTD